MAETCNNDASAAFGCVAKQINKLLLMKRSPHVKRTIALLIAAGVTACAFAQPADRPGRGRGGPPDPEWILNRIADRLELNEAQRAALAEKVEAKREDFRAAFENMRAVRQAERDGDTALADQLRAEVGDNNPRTMFDGILTELEPMLDDSQVERIAEWRERGPRGPGEGGRGRWGGDGDRRGGPFRELGDRLQLSEEQWTEAREIIAEHRAEVSDEDRGGMRDLFRKMRDARDSGDEATIAELQSEMDAARAARAEHFDTLLTKIEPILTDDQLDELDAFREDLRFRMENPPPPGEGRFGRQRGGPEAADGDPFAPPPGIDEAPARQRGDRRSPRGEERPGETDLRTVARVLRLIDLEDDQKEQLTTMQREAYQAYRKIDRRNRKAQAEATQAFIADVKKVLNDEQRAEFEKLLERRSQRRPDRPQRPERPRIRTRENRQSPDSDGG